MGFLFIIILGILSGFPAPFQIIPEHNSINGIDESINDIIAIDDEVQERTVSSSEVYSKAKDTVLRIKIVDKSTGNEYVVGTGFFLSKEGLVLTNHHVIDDVLKNPDLSIQAADHNGNTYEEITIGYASLYKDIAILEYKGDNDFSFLTLAEEKSKVGNKLFLYGNPAQSPFLESKGFIFDEAILSNVRTHVDKTILTASFNTAQLGSSGSPVLNENAQVVAMLYAKDQKRERVLKTSEHQLIEEEIITPGNVSFLIGLSTVREAFAEYERYKEFGKNIDMYEKKCNSINEHCYRVGEYFFFTGNINKAREYFERSAYFGDNISAGEKFETIGRYYENNFFEYQADRQDIIYSIHEYLFNKYFPLYNNIIFPVSLVLFLITSVFVSSRFFSGEKKGPVNLKKRFVAYLTDGIFNILLIYVFFNVYEYIIIFYISDESLPVLSTFLSFVSAVCFSFFFYALSGGSSVGKTMVNLRVLDENAQMLAFGKYFARELFLKDFLSFFAIRKMLPQYKDKELLHDEICRTKVL